MNRAKMWRHYLVVIGMVILVAVWTKTSYAEEDQVINLQETTNLQAFTIDMILDPDILVILGGRAFEWTDRYSSSTKVGDDFITDQMAYSYRGNLKSEEIRFYLEFVKCATPKRAQEALAEIMDSVVPVRDFSDFTYGVDLMDLKYDTAIIKESSDEMLFFDHGNIVNFAGVAGMMDNVSIMRPEEAAESAAFLGFAGMASSLEPNVEAAKKYKDGKGPFLYDRNYRLKSASVEMTYAFMCTQDTFAVVTLSHDRPLRYMYPQEAGSDRPGPFSDADMAFQKADMTKNLNEVISLLENEITPLADQIREKASTNDLFKEGLISGYTDLKRAKVVLDLGGDQVFETVSLDSGLFRFDTGLTNNDLIGSKGYVRVYMDYYNDDQEIFNLIYDFDKVFMEMDIDFETVKDFDLGNFVWNDFRDLKTQPKVGKDGEDTLKSLLKTYEHIAQAYEFYLNYVGINLRDYYDRDEPLSVYTMRDDEGTCYSTIYDDIYISVADFDLKESDRPMNCEWHEFHHFAMDQLDFLPINSNDYSYSEEERKLIPTTDNIHTFYDNHAGYVNASTADSWCEGYAEFMSLMMAKYYEYPRPDHYAGHGSLEDNYRAQTDEEFAIAGILWDIVDGPNDYTYKIDDDQMTMEFSHLWGVMAGGMKRNFHEVYELLVDRCESGVASKEELDRIFIVHGFFVDLTEGNLLPDPIDPSYFDSFSDKTYQVDSPMGGFVYEEGDEVGRPAELVRPYRKQAGGLPGSYIKTDCVDDYYRIYVTLDALPDLMRYLETVKSPDGLIYIPMPPQAYKASIEVISGSGDSVTLRSDDYYETFGNGAPYILDYNFESSGNEEDRKHPITIDSVNYDTGYNLAFYDLMSIANNEGKAYETILADYEQGHEGALKDRGIDLTSKTKSDSKPKTDSEDRRDQMDGGIFSRILYLTVYGFPILIGGLLVVTIIRKRS